MEPKDVLEQRYFSTIFRGHTHGYDSFFGVTHSPCNLREKEVNTLFRKWDLLQQ